MVFTKRDQSILISLFKNKVLSRKQIHQFFFNDSKLPVVSRRLSKLQKEGYISKKGVILENKNQSYFFIRKEGLGLILEDLLGEVDHVGYKSDSIVHDLNLADITNVFEKLENVNEVYSESELLSVKNSHLEDCLLPFKTLRSDRIVKISVGDEEVLAALEYERTLKSTKRIKAKFRDYYLHESITDVLYVCESKAMLEVMMKIDKDVCEDQVSKIFFTLRKDVFFDSKQLTFKNHLDDEVVFKFNQ